MASPHLGAVNPTIGMTVKCLTSNIIIGALTVVLATACANHPGRTADARLQRISADEVISWAHLDDVLRHHLDQLRVGEADGKTILADYVIVLNGEEMVRFVRKHGYESFRGPIAVRQRDTSLEVDVQIIGNDGATTVITLFADGTMQGVG